MNGGAGGAIVNVSSGAARLGAPNEYVDYAASKGAIDTFTDTHPVVQAAKRLVSPHRRRHAGILVDVTERVQTAHRLVHSERLSAIAPKVLLPMPCVPYSITRRGRALRPLLIWFMRVAGAVVGMESP